MRRLRVGIIGAGNVTRRTLIPLLSGLAEAAPEDGWNRAAMAPKSGAQNAREATPILAALAASNSAETTAARVLAQSARVSCAYEDWRVMLRETELDVVMCAALPETAAQILVTLCSWRSASPSPRAVWICGPPAPSSQAAAQLLQMTAGRDFNVWCAHPLRHEFAHRAALRLLERDHIGALAALDFRSASSFPARVLAPENASRNGAAESENEAFAAAYGTFSCLLSMAGGVSVSAARVTAARRGEATNVWLQLAAGTLVSARFCAADTWNAPLPRLEIVGSDGRFLVCEGGRRLWQHEPRQAAHMVEPPASSPRLSGAGVAEDARAFLSRCASPLASSQSAPQLASPFASTRGALESDSEAARLSREHDLDSSIRALRLVEAAAFCARENCFVTLERDGVLPRSAPLEATLAAQKRAALEKTAPPLFAVPPLKASRESTEEIASRRAVAAATDEISETASPNLKLPW